MSDLLPAIWVEVLKARRSRVPWITAVAFAIGTGVGGLFMFILGDPGRARSMGLLGDKARLTATTADWPGYFALLAQIVAVGGLLIYGLSSIWLFGREFADRTAKDLLALPTSRTVIVTAKFTVAAAWCLVLALGVCLLGSLIGAALGLPGWSPGTAVQGTGRLVAVAASTFLLTTPFACAASAGRGYLVAVGVMFAALFAAQIIAALGYGGYFPWSVPGLSAGMAGDGRPPPGAFGHGLVILTGLGGVLATVQWWRLADHQN